MPRATPPSIPIRTPTSWPASATVSLRLPTPAMTSIQGIVLCAVDTEPPVFAHLVLFPATIIHKHRNPFCVPQKAKQEMGLCFRQKPSPGFLKGLQNERKTTNIYILVLQCANEEAEKKVSDVLEQNLKQFSPKSKTVGAGGIEWTVEVRIQECTPSLSISCMRSRV